MPTIQLKVTDDQFNHLTTLTNQATGSKAVFAAITELEELRNAFTELYQDYQEAVRIQQIYRSRIDNMQSALSDIIHTDAKVEHTKPRTHYFSPDK